MQRIVYAESWRVKHEILWDSEMQTDHIISDKKTKPSDS